MIKIDNRYAFF